MRSLLVALALAAVSGVAYAEDTEAPSSDAPIEPPTQARAAKPAPKVVVPSVPQPIVGFRIRGDTKTRDRVAPFLSRYDIGDLVTDEDRALIEQAFISSELFESAVVTFEPAPGGVLVVATVVDKHSWIIAPTVFALPGRKSFGFGFAENNFLGLNQKLLLYAQYGDRDSLFFGTYLIPSFRGTPLQLRFDVYAFDRFTQEFANPPDDARDASLARETETTYLGGGVLVGWRFAWWLTSDIRFRSGLVDYVRSFDPATPDVDITLPDKDGIDTSVQARVTLDARNYRFGVSWGPFLQLIGDVSIPGLSDYDYSMVLYRAYYSWRLFEEHQLEVRTTGGIGYHLPFHNDFTLGSVSDLRGYATDRLRGDTRWLGRFEYSVPITKWRFFAFRAIGFFDAGYMTTRRARADRALLPEQRNGTSYFRTDVGAGVRLYVKAIVLPLLGLDVGYGIEARTTEVFFQLGLTDF